MAMNLIIQERRRQLGMTQEQVAEYLGVTAPAVNKWEKGNTCPDITLLAPLARLLKIDVNTLLEFHEELSQNELVVICKEIREIVERDGIDAGFLYAHEKIREYPNSDMLLYNCAAMLQGLLLLKFGPQENTDGSDNTEEYMLQIEKWNERLANSEETVIKNSALFMLVSRAIGREEYEKAQVFLDQMPNRNDMPDKRIMQATIYMKQNRIEETITLMQQALLGAVNDAQMILFKLLDAELSAGELVAAEYVAECLTKLAETFDLSLYNREIGTFQLAVAKKDVEQTIAILRLMLETLDINWNVQDSLLYDRIVSNDTGTYMKQILRAILDGLKTEGEYAYLRDSKDFWDFIDEVECKESTGR